MCKSKPGVRCSKDTCDLADDAAAAYQEAIPGGPAVSTLDAGVAMMSADEIDEVAYRVHDELASDDVLRTDDMEVGYRFERDEFVTSVVDYTLDIPVGQRAEQRYYDAAKDAFEQTAKDPSNVTPPAVSWDTHYWSDVSTSVVRDAVAAVLTEKTRSSGS